MIKALKKKYALSDQGAKDLLKGFVYSVLANISLMFPVILLAIVLNQLLAPVLGASAPEISAAVYTVIGIVILAVVFIFIIASTPRHISERMMKAQGGVSGLRKIAYPSAELLPPA